MSDNPLLKALPPETDYLSYLTILEYNLNLEQLSTLHEILQDTTLTSNIGWDLVHLLLPLLPASQPCLQDVARLGNPREVVLKVTELLEGLAVSQEEEEEKKSENSGVENEGGVLEEEEIKDALGVATDADIPQDQSHHDHQPSMQPYQSPSKVMQFVNLLEMLAILHPRIKTKYPSRFLSTALQAVLPAYARLAGSAEALAAVFAFVKALSGFQRPALPPRKSSSRVPSQAQLTPQPAPDPEGQSDPVAQEEIVLIQRLLQSFLTFVVEGYVSALPANEDTAGMAWSSRWHEKRHPEKTIPGRMKLIDRFAEDESLHARDTTMGQMLALGHEVKLDPNELIHTLKSPSPPASPSEEVSSPDLPSSASDVPLSRLGSLYLVVASLASTLFFSAPSRLPPLHTYQDFSTLLAYFIALDSNIGAESYQLIDALLFLGLSTVDQKTNRAPEDEMTFRSTLQRLSLLSALIPSAALRFSAHTLCGEILHAYPDPQVRSSFIEDTLLHCPYENLKASAVGWLKDEVLSTSAPTSSPPPAVTTDDNDGTRKNVFTTPACIHLLAPYLFFDPDTLSSDEEFLAHEGFFLAVLNLCILFLSSPTLSQSLRFTAVITAKAAWLEKLESKALELGDEEGVLLKGNIALVKEKLNAEREGRELT
ncbi:MAG: hypothetical protein Q9214_002845 [Letrouitia sp. 1 TL-2023]